MISLDRLLTAGFRLAQLVQAGPTTYTNCYVKLRNMGFPVVELAYIADGIVVKHITITNRDISISWEVQDYGEDILD